MKSQFILLFTVLIIILLSIFIYPHEETKYPILENLKKEIHYMIEKGWENNITDFLEFFKNYSKSVGTDFKYEIINNSEEYKEGKIFYGYSELCKKEIKLLPLKKYICICVYIKDKDEEIKDFFCI